MSVVLFACGTLWLEGCSGCSSDSSSPEDAKPEQADAEDVRPGDVEDQDVAKPEGKEEEIQPEVPPEDLCTGAPLCKEGEFKCNGSTKIKYCQKTEDGCYGEWSPPEPCEEGKVCKTGKGCVCELGGCADGDVLDDVCTGKILAKCEEWTCDQGCCATAEIGPPECCQTAADCRDCIDLETGEIIDCPTDPIPAGYVENLCTMDSCLKSCSHTPPPGFDDGEACTIDSCDPLTGEITHLLDDGNKDCFVVPCWGLTQKDADDICDDLDACTAEECVYPNGFQPWEFPGAPDVDKSDPLSWPDSVGQCKTQTGICNDYDFCTIDYCDKLMGCSYENDYENPDCFCDEDSDCKDYQDPETKQKLNACTTDWCFLADNHCKFDNMSAEAGGECDDYNACTVDSCNPDTPDGQDPCVHVFDQEKCPCADPDDSCSVADECADTVECDGETVLNNCTIDLCVPFDNPGQEPEFSCCQWAEVSCEDNCVCTDLVCNPCSGKCEGEELDCDDEIPCTIDTCDCDAGCQHTPKKCTPKPCYTSFCDNLTGECKDEEIPGPQKPCKKTMCDPVTGTYSWVARDCGSEEVPPNPCTVDSCDPETDSCKHEPKNCDDNNCCTTDYCDPVSGLCVHDPMDCEEIPADYCTYDTCHPALCDCTHLPKSFDDKDQCTLDSCDPKTGAEKHVPKVCTCDDPKTYKASCNPAVGCICTPIDVNCAQNGVTIDTLCDDKNGCTVDTCACEAASPNDPDYCLSGFCAAPEPLKCESASLCFYAVCDPVKGKCNQIPKNCDDSNGCTLDSCEEATGKCLHEPLVCNDNNKCTDNKCDPKTQCF